MRTRWAYEENEAELRRAFAAFSGDLTRGNLIADLMSSYLPMLGVTEQTIPAIDAHTDAILAALDAHFAVHEFILGERLSLADCALMGPLYAHLYLDRVTRKKLYDEAIHVCQWIERCNRPVPEQMGGFFDGEYPDSLKAILRLIAADAVPLLESLEAGFNEWAAGEAESGAELPRGVGEYHSVLRNRPFTAAVRSYVPWKIQRFRADYEQSSAASRALTENVLRNAGCQLLLNKPENSVVLRKEQFKVVFG
jgi:hypothetical protein